MYHSPSCVSWLRLPPVGLAHKQHAAADKLTTQSTWRLTGFPSTFSANGTHVVTKNSLLSLCSSFQPSSKRSPAQIEPALQIRNKVFSYRLHCTDQLKCGE
ncbi:hypothetical protein GN956_G21560 [Arapaima gigas]